MVSKLKGRKGGFGASHYGGLDTTCSWFILFSLGGLEVYLIAVNRIGRAQS